MVRFAINRPITTIMGVLALIVFGLMSFRSMPVALFPNVDFPIVTVQTAYYGADPESVESKVTDKIEEAVSTIDGIDKLMSASSEGMSVVTIQFELTKDVTEAANDVRDKVSAVVFDRDVEKPVIKKVDAGGGSVVNLFVATESGDWTALMRLADERIKPRLQRVDGVGEINIVGYRDRQVRIYADPFLLNKYGLSVAELNNLLAVENVKRGGGKLVHAGGELVIKTEGDAVDLADMGNIQVMPGVRLKDVARIEDGMEDAKSYSSLNGVPGVMLEVKKISGANTLRIIEGVKKAMPDVERMAGSGYKLELVQDQSGKILAGINQVTFDLIFGAILAVVIVFLFLRNFTATIVAALAIPTSIIGTFALVDYLGYDLNRLTLIGLTLAIGIFIDDAIVVLENISKKLEAGIKPFMAAYEGIKEMAFSILAISSVLLSVFVPVAFMDGMVGRFFNSFAMTVASGILISFLVAIMLIPSLGARVLRKGESRFFHKTEPIFVALDRGYVALLRPLIRFKTFTILAAVGILIASGTLLKSIGGDFVPMEDNSEFQVFVKAPVGISLEGMKEKTLPLVKRMEEDPRIEATVLSIGYSAAKEIHKAKIYAKLVPVEQREARQPEIVAEYREAFADLKGLFVSVEEVAPFDTGMSNAPVQVVITGEKLEVLEKVAADVQALLGDIPGAVDIDNDYEKGKPELTVVIQRQNAKRLGVSAQEIAAVINTAFSSDVASTNFEEEGRQFDVTLRFSDQFRRQVEDLKTLQIRTADGRYVSLEGLVKFEETTGAASINRFDRERKIMVTSNLEGATLDVVVGTVREKIGEILPEGYGYRFTGDIENMEETNLAFVAAVSLAIILIYLILAALYESIIQPIIIMVAMPLSFTGVVLALYLTGRPFSLFVMIGVILLLGMVGKNAILVVDFANQAVKRGKGVEEALLEAGEKRLRPILMTTFAIVFAMLPLALSTGAGHESNAPMAIAIIGGLLSSTFLTLLVVPAIYRFLEPIDIRLRRLYEKGTV